MEKKRDNTFSGSVIEAMINSDGSFKGARLVYSNCATGIDVRCCNKIF
jgi:hypothetical protein